MSRLANQEASELSETRALRDRRDHLLRKVDRARPQTRQRSQSIPEPLGDARPAAVSPFQSRLPYKD